MGHSCILDTMRFSEIVLSDHFGDSDFFAISTQFNDFELDNSKLQRLRV